MNEPRRLLRDPETNPLGRALLRAGHDEEAPIGGEERLLALLGLPGGGPPDGDGGDGSAAPEAPAPELPSPLDPSAFASSPPSQAAASAVRSSRVVTAAKALLLAAALGGTFVGGFWAGRSSAPSAAPVTVAAVSPTAVPSVVEAPVASAPPGLVAVAPASATRVAAPPARRAPTAAPSASANGESDSLAAQLVLLAEARNALLAGNSRETLRRSGAYLQRFPEGALREEASALRVEALWRDGDRSRALVERDRFVDRFPQSVYVQRLHTLGADEPTPAP